MRTHCRLGSQGGLFRTVSRSGLGAGFQQRGQHLDHVDPVNDENEDYDDDDDDDDDESQDNLFELKVEAGLLHEQNWLKPSLLKNLPRDVFRVQNGFRHWKITALCSFSVTSWIDVWFADQ